MEKIPGIISVGVLAIIAILLGCFFKKVVRQYADFVVYCFLLFIYELGLLTTGLFHIENHLIANLNTLFYSGLSIYIIANIYRRYHPEHIPFKAMITVLMVFLLVAWVAENFIVGNTIFVFNSKLPGAVSVVNVLACIYLINVLLFAKSGSFLKDPDILIIGGILIRSITFGFALWFLNFDYNFDRVFVSNLLTSINIGLCLSDLFFLYAVQRIIYPKAWIKK